MLTSTGWTKATSLREGAGWYRVGGGSSTPGEPPGRYCAERSLLNAKDIVDDIDMRWWCVAWYNCYWTAWYDQSWYTTYLKLRTVQSTAWEIPLKKIRVMIHILTPVMVLIANQDKFVVFRNTAETVCSTITLLLVECHRRYKWWMALTASNNALFPGRENG